MQNNKTKTKECDTKDLFFLEKGFKAESFSKICLAAFKYYVQV